MLPLTDASHHTYGPKDLGLDPEKKSVMSVDIARTTNHTGEQIHISVPMYSDDDRETVLKRLGFAYSVIQDRMESENKAMEFVKERSETIRRAEAIISRNENHLKLELEKLGKLAKRNKISKQEFEVQRDKLMKGLEISNSETKKTMDHAHAEIRAGHPIEKEEEKDL